MTEKFNVLLSFPRSGNTWLRYAVEFISKRPTCQAPFRRCAAGLEKKGAISSDLNLGVDTKEKAILVKRHRADFKWDTLTKENCRLVLLVRNYKEAVLRHAFASRKQDDEAELKKCIEGYLHCLHSYDKFDGDKLLIYYEDIITKPKAEIGRLIDFLGVARGKWFNEFFNNYQHHKNRSLKYYRPAGTMTRGDATKLMWHSQRAKPETLKIIEKGVKRDEIYLKYLKRYG